MQGLYVSPQRNCEQISKRIDRNSQSLNHFISNSPWNWQHACDQLAHLFVKMIPSGWKNDLCLVIDESGFPKKGKHSVGVAHQYCGQSGKLDNSQVGVFSALVCRGFYSVIAATLYLPKKWCGRKDVDIPLQRREHKTKIELAYELILHARNILNIPFQWVNFDSYYGRDQGFLYNLDKEGITFVADIPKDVTLYKKRPRVYLPKKKTSKGRKYTRYQVAGKSIKAYRLVEKLSEKDFKKLTIRIPQQGKPVKALYYACKVYLAIKEHGQVLEAKLLIRKDADGTIKYALTNDVRSSLHRLGVMHGQRYFIERSFQELKQQLGMNEYQVRGYQGWHRHMTMCMMGLLFIQTEKMSYFKIKEAPSTPQLAELIRIILPQKIRTMMDVLGEFKPLASPKDHRKRTIKKSVT